MRLKTYRAQNYLTARAAVVEIPADAHAVVVAGPNGAGKTGMLEAIRYILTGDLPRGIAYKKDLPTLITEGEKDGWIGATFRREDGHDTEYKIGLKSGSVSNPPPYSAAAALSIAPQTFMAMDANARRGALFNLFGVSLKATDIIATLAQAGHSEARLERLRPSFAAGFPATVKRAKELASEARGAWQATTGETYGAQKAAGWAAPVLEVGDAADPRALEAQLADKRAEVTDAARRWREAKQAEEAHGGAEDARHKASRLPEEEAVLAAHDAKIAQARTELATHKAAAAVGAGWTCPCPQCGTVLKSERAGSLVVYDEGAASGPRAAAIATAAQIKLEDLERERAPLARRVDACRAAKLLLERLPARPAPGAVEALAEASNAATEELRLLEEALDAAKAAQTAEADAAKATAAAARYHEDVSAFTELAAAIDALPARFLADTLAKVNEALDAVSKAFGTPVSLYEDMALRYGAIPYPLLSESQKWRADLALGLALAPQASGIVLMDRLDMVQPQDRGAIFQMLGAQTRAQVIVGATLKERPAFPEGCGLHVHWIGA